MVNIKICWNSSEANVRVQWELFDMLQSARHNDRKLHPSSKEITARHKTKASSERFQCQECPGYNAKHRTPGRQKEM
jgi:hypothetical protein